MAILSLLLTYCKDDDPKPFKPSVEMSIEHTWNDSSLKLNKAYVWEHDFQIDSIIPSTLIYHINHLRLLTQDSLAIDANKEYYMVDYEDKQVYPEQIRFNAPLEGVKYYVTSLEFTLGVADSLANSTGKLNSLFIAPMYWGMIQGYIGFKFEALSPQAPDKALIYHIGGYTKPFYNARRIRLNLKTPFLLNRDNQLVISANIFKIFKSKHEVDIRSIDKIHLPDANSVIIADNAAEIFSIKRLK